MSDYDPKLDAVRDVIAKLRRSGMLMIADDIEALVACVENQRTRQLPVASDRTS